MWSHCVHCGGLVTNKVCISSECTPFLVTCKTLLLNGDGCLVHMQVSSATSRMSSKNEAGVAASLALVRIAIRQLTHTTLQYAGKVSHP